MQARNNYKELSVVGIAGSLRRESYNRKALRIAIRFVQETGAQVKEIDLNEFHLPIFNEDLTVNGFPEIVQQMKTIVDSADILLIASPEYNYSVPAVLKNAIEWISRGKNSLDGKIAAIFGASTGPFGTIRMQPHLRQILASLNVAVVPQPQVFIRFAGEAFNVDGSMKDKHVEGQLKVLIEKSILLTSDQKQKAV